MNAHDSIVDGVLQALRYPAPVTTGRIEEELDLDTIGEAEFEAIGVTLEGSNPSQSYIGSPVDWFTQITVANFARVDSRQAVPIAGRASRALHARVYERLMADPSLGGRAFGLDEPQLTFDNLAGDTRAGICTARYTVRHRTAAQTLEV